MDKPVVGEPTQKEKEKAGKKGRGQGHMAKAKGLGNCRSSWGSEMQVREGHKPQPLGSLTGTLPEPWFRAAQGSDKSTQVGSSTDE